jgi:hypothetical protein
MKHKKNISRGQAALEFLMTYGWAMLILTAIVAGFVYVIPHPQSLTTNKCLFGSSIPCLGSQSSANNLTIVLRNGMGQSIYNISANVTMPKEMTCGVTNNVTLRAEEKLLITCDNTILGLKDDAKVRIVLSYQKIKGGFSQIVIGELYAKYT